MRRLIGIDISAEMLRRACDRLPGCLVRGSALRLPFADGQFDGVVAVHVLHLVPDLTATLREAARMLRPGGRVVTIHGVPEHADDDLSRATIGLQVLSAGRPDSPGALRAAADDAGLQCVRQQPARPRTGRHSPAEVADLISRRTWSHLWHLTDDQWHAHVEPVLDALRELPDQQRPRPQETRMTVSVLERA